MYIIELNLGQGLNWPIGGGGNIALRRRRQSKAIFDNLWLSLLFSVISGNLQVIFGHVKQYNKIFWQS